MVKPRSANTVSAAKLINVYQKPCTCDVRNVGINTNVTGPEIMRHKLLTKVNITSLVTLAFIDFEILLILSDLDDDEVDDIYIL
ncbi:hypothetical protein HDF18_24000 [Mucilaginibacter sp. X5P1]|uniref:hypothetical protein n=1 Tax=Mucilaginibacter sp. X5P1 TaxID=2723088 RepID=UPI00161FDA8A|nr:hypothetical protein [Mucilaginibacter sp. X5P1]MBB6141215.1 hypothetical protein [Mucilaginibacter sp. X5P1]